MNKYLDLIGFDKYHRAIQKRIDLKNIFIKYWENKTPNEIIREVQVGDYLYNPNNKELYEFYYELEGSLKIIYKKIDPIPNDSLYIRLIDNKLFRWDKNLEDMVESSIEGDAVEVTYNLLKTLITSKLLDPGTFYKIIDYETTTSQLNTLSAGHPFDIIVLATSSSTLSEDALADKREGDLYFGNSNLGAWLLKYTIENDFSRFAWASSSGKGIIYYMKDEWGNECPYDFKNILFRRITVESSKYEELNGTYSGLSEYILLKGWQNGLEEASNPELDYFYTFHVIDTHNGNMLDASVMLYKKTNPEEFPNSDLCHNNIIKPVYKFYITDNECEDIAQTLPNIVFINTHEYNETFFDCSNNKFGVNSYYNTFQNNCHDNNFPDNFIFNTFGEECYNITINSLNYKGHTNTPSNLYYHALKNIYEVDAHSAYINTDNLWTKSFSYPTEEKQIEIRRGSDVRVRNDNKRFILNNSSIGMSHVKNYDADRCTFSPHCKDSVSDVLDNSRVESEILLTNNHIDLIARDKILQHSGSAYIKTLNNLDLKSEESSVHLYGDHNIEISTGTEYSDGIRGGNRVILMSPTTEISGRLFYVSGRETEIDSYNWIHMHALDTNITGWNRVEVNSNDAIELSTDTLYLNGPYNRFDVVSYPTKMYVRLANAQPLDTFDIKTANLHIQSGLNDLQYDFSENKAKISGGDLSSTKKGTIEIKEPYLSTTFNQVKNNEKTKAVIAPEGVWATRIKDSSLNPEKVNFDINGINSSNIYNYLQGAGLSLSGDNVSLAGKDKIMAIAGSAWLKANTKVSLEAFNTFEVKGNKVEITGLSDGIILNGGSQLKLGSDGYKLTNNGLGLIEASNSKLSISDFNMVDISTKLRTLKELNVNYLTSYNGDLFFKYDGHLVPIVKTLLDGQEVTAAALVDLDKRIINLNTQKVEQTILTTYADLVTLRNTNKLCPGLLYRITDYTATTRQSDTLSANHKFDIIARADSENKLNENAKAILNTTDHYFDNSNLAAWEIKYCIDNDTNRFAWADDTDTVISFIGKDGNNEETEFVYDSHNDYGYVWKSINGETEVGTDNRNPEVGDDIWSDLVLQTPWGTVKSLKDTTPTGKGVIYYMKDEYNNECPYDFKNIMFEKDVDGIGLDYYYTFSWLDSSFSIIREATVNKVNTSSEENYSIYLNSISPNITVDGIQHLNKIIFIQDYNTHDVFKGIYSNKFGNCWNSVLQGSCSQNVFGEYCSNITLTNSSRNIFGNYCYDITCESNYNNNVIGLGCNSIRVLKPYVRDIIIEPYNLYIDITSTAVTGPFDYLENFIISSKTNIKTVTVKTISHNTTGDTFKTIYLSPNSTIVTV